MRASTSIAARSPMSESFATPSAMRRGLKKAMGAGVPRPTSLFLRRRRGLHPAPEERGEGEDRDDDDDVARDLQRAAVATQAPYPRAPPRRRRPAPARALRRR